MKNLFLSGLIILFDQITKVLVEKYLYFRQLSIIDNIFLLTYVQNRGGAWGILSGVPMLFLILVPAVIVMLIFFLFKSNNSLEKLSISMIIGGAVGNFIDRISRGYVVDFLDFRIWPVFNVADIFVVIGGVLLIFSAIRLKKNGN